MSQEILTYISFARSLDPILVLQVLQCSFFLCQILPIDVFSVCTCFRNLLYMRVCAALHLFEFWHATTISALHGKCIQSSNAFHISNPYVRSQIIRAGDWYIQSPYFFKFFFFLAALLIRFSLTARCHFVNPSHICLSLLRKKLADDFPSLKEAFVEGLFFYFEIKQALLKYL